MVPSKMLRGFLAQAHGRFYLQVLWRVAALVLTSMGFAVALRAENLWTTLCVASLGLALISLSIVRLLTKHLRDLTRILTSIRGDDLSQRMHVETLAPSHRAFAEEINRVLHDFRVLRASEAEEARYRFALVEHCPVAMLAIASVEQEPLETEATQLDLLNRAARRLLGGRTMADRVSIDALPADLARAFATAEPGSRTLVACRLNDANLRLSIQTTAIDSGGVRRRLIACESLSREIDSAESQAWQRVVRVLAHEMVNSLTPVTSLAETTLTLLDEIRAQEKSSSDPSAWRTEALQDMHDGLATIAKRGRSLMTFVQNYRKVANLPRPDRSWFRIEALFADLAHLYEPSWRPRHIALKTEVIPRHLQLWADRNQVEQALINLLKNAAESIEAQRSTASQDNASSPSNVVSMLASLDHDGSVRIVVRDSGMGFADEALQDIFVPFFTTKAQGSGIGLGLVRQIMLAHDGTVSASNVAGGGASFELRFDPSTNTGTESAMAPASK